MNWNVIATPPDTRCYYKSISMLQADYHFGFCDENTFIGLMNLYFDLAWEEAYGKYKGA